MKAFINKISLILLMTAMAASCGGGGGDGDSVPITSITVSGTVTLPDSVTDKQWLVGIDDDLDGDNGLVTFTAGVVTGSTFNYSIDNVPSGDYFIYGEVNMTDTLGPWNVGDYVGVGCGTIDSPCKVTIDSSKTVDFTLDVLDTESLTIANASIIEGNSGTTNLTFTVSLSGTAPGPVDVNYATSDGTATAGSDYTATSGTLTIASGTSAGSINVPIMGDAVVEANETFTLTLSNPANAILLGSPAVATGTITNDDSASAATIPLNDTGITTCSDPYSNGLSCPVTGFEGQDAEYGRDVTANDDSDGHAGFSFTKLDSSGNALPASATSWSCVLDNVTGLTWEVKTTTGLQSSAYTYTWYNSTGVNDGGLAGTANGGACVDATNCDTEKYVAAVNATALCGTTDWRLPSKHELLSIVNNNNANPAIDANYFPNSQFNYYWSSSPYANYGYSAWNVYFDYGYVGWEDRNVSNYVRLVRGSQ